MIVLFSSAGSTKEEGGLEGMVRGSAGAAAKGDINSVPAAVKAHRATAGAGARAGASGAGGAVCMMFTLLRGSWRWYQFDLKGGQQCQVERTGG